MKKSLLQLTLLIGFANAFSQSDISGPFLGHQRLPGRYVGWSPTPPGSIAGPLDVRNDFNEPMRFFTSANNFERVRIFEGGLSPSAPLGGGLAITSNPISPIFSPASLLHIGVDVGVLPGSIGLAGWRNWMSVGTYYAAGNDNMYVGAKQEGGPDRNDAVINWGDNAAGGPGGAPDYLRFIFTGSFNNGPVGTSTSIDGLEVMRSSPFGRVGIGNYFNNPINPALLEPARRLEILSDKPNFTANGNPQFRITHTPTQTAPIVVAGKYTDFHTTNQGDIVINPRNDGIVAPLLKDRFVGIHTNLPGNTLEINSQLLSPVTANGAPVAGFGAPTGKAGLRFSDLTSTSTVQANPNTTSRGVLSVDANGDVIYVPGGGSVTANNGVSTNTAGIVQLGVPCNSGIFAIAANSFTTNRVVFHGNNNLWFASAKTHTSGVGIGGQPIGIPGYNFCDVGNTLELSANARSKYVWNAPTGASGLRFTNLTSASATLANGTNGLNATKLLSVDSDGDVVLTTAIGLQGPPGPPGPPGLPGTSSFANNGLSLNGTNTVVLGGPAGAAGAAGLLNNREIPMNSQFIQFAGDGNIGIGGASGAPVDKLHIQDNLNSQRGIWIKNFNAGGSASSRILLQNDVNNFGYLQLGSSTNNSFPNKLALVSQSSNLHIEAQGGNHVEVFANGGSKVLIGAVTPSQSVPSAGAQYRTIVNDGLLVDGQSISSTPALKIRDFNGGSYDDVGYFGQLNNNPGASLMLSNPTFTSSPYQVLFSSVGGALGMIGTTNQQGMLNVGGSIYSNGVLLGSDSTLKTNIQSISSSWATQKIKNIRPVSYEWINPVDTLMYGTKYGFTAQQVETQIPNLVHTDSLGKKTLDYNGIIALLTKALQSEIRRGDKQDSLIQVLTQNINACCENQQAKQTGIKGNDKNAENQIANQLNVDLSDKDVIVLNQNIPNPYAEHTIITYNVPVQFKYAQMIFKTIDGRIIKTTDLEKGKGQLNVFASDLSNGLYMYTLIVDGKEFDTKKMVKQN